MAGAKPPQPQVEIGADEGAVDALGHQRLASERLEAGAKAIAGTAGRKRRAFGHGVMTNMNDRAAMLAPRPEQGQPVRIDRLVPAPRPGRRIERLLHVDRQQHGLIPVDGHGL